MTIQLSHLDNSIHDYKYSVKYSYGIVLHTFPNTNIHHSEKAISYDNTTYFLWTALPKIFLSNVT